MPRIGLKSATIAKRDSNSYTNKSVFGRIIDEKADITYNEAELYADDTLAESDYSFASGKLNVTTADDDEDMEKFVLGIKKTTENGFTNSIDDVAPEVGYGHIITKLINGVKKWKVEIFPRVKFSKVNTDNKTRGKNLEFGTTTYEGTIMALDTPCGKYKAGEWKDTRLFDEENEAIEYLNEALTSKLNTTSTGETETLPTEPQNDSTTDTVELDEE